ncbi:MAG: transposase [Candidatus Electrothrix sp. AX5]|nr:transposase [Candidatus Electrothrix sp. AX5]
MKYNPDTHRRRSIRLRNYDYSQAGAYFVTICTQHRECLFGEITDGTMQLNAAGSIVADQWMKTGDIRKEIELDAWTVMPNHFHWIAVLIDGKGTARRAPTTERFGKPVSGSIPTIVRAFKSAVTKHINILRNTPGMKLWQRNYWEHIIRDENELYRIREYIQNNPTRWQEDALHPDQGPFPGETREPTPPYGHEVWMV